MHVRDCSQLGGVRKWGHYIIEYLNKSSDREKLEYG